MKPDSNSKWEHKCSCLGMSVCILSLSLLLLFNKWVQTSYDIVQESIKSYMSSSSKEKGYFVNSPHQWPTRIDCKCQKNQVYKILKTEYTALLHIAALITCSPASLKACSQILLFQHQLQKYVLSPGGKKNKEGESEISSPRPSESIFQAGFSKNAEIFQGEGLEMNKMWRTCHGQHTIQGTFVSRWSGIFMTV